MERKSVLAEFSHYGLLSARKINYLAWQNQPLRLKISQYQKILDRTMTRWSQVTHYFFENCAYYRPMGSHVITGKIDFFDPLNVCTRRPVGSLYAERPLPSDYVAQCQERMLLSPEEGLADRLPEDFDSARYLTLHPDVAEAGVDPAYHYMTHGRFEGREYK